MQEAIRKRMKQLEKTRHRTRLQREVLLEKKRQLKKDSTSSGSDDTSDSSSS